MSEKIIHGRNAADIQRQHSTAIKHHKSPGKDLPADRILRLQQSVGNQAVQRMYKAGLIQAKLTVGASNDAFEQEADRVADRVMRMPEPQLQREPLKEEDERLRKKELSGASFELGPDAERQVQSLEGGGRPLPETVRDFMEPRFGADFGSVRLHTDASAAESARAINAQAYTLGRNIVFGEGRYAPDTSEGKHLLAHELTHVVQQNGSGKPAVQRKIEVNPGLQLDTMGYATSKSGNVYTCPKVAKDTIWHEMFTSLLNTPRVFKVAGNSNGDVNANFKKHMAARHGILEFASKKKYTFGAGPNFKMNPDYWVVDSSSYRVKPGVDRDKAIKDLNVHPEKYSIACQAATKLTMEGGSKSSDLAQDNGVGGGDWIPGDWGYIKKTNFPPGGTPGLEGENIIYSGADKFWGHFGAGNEYKTLNQWFAQVDGWDPTGGADVLGYRLRPKVGLE